MPPSADVARLNVQARRQIAWIWHQVGALDIMQIMSSRFLALLEEARENGGLTVKNCYPSSDFNLCRRLPTICTVVF